MPRIIMNDPASMLGTLLEHMPEKTSPDDQEAYMKKLLEDLDSDDIQVVRKAAERMKRLYEAEKTHSTALTNLLDVSIGAVELLTKQLHKS